MTNSCTPAVSFCDRGLGYRGSKKTNWHVNRPWQKKPRKHTSPSIHIMSKLHASPKYFPQKSNIIQNHFLQGLFVTAKNKKLKYWNIGHTSNAHPQGKFLLNYIQNSGQGIIPPLSLRAATWMLQLSHTIPKLV